MYFVFQDAATKAAAEEKLDLVTELIGYPDSWESYDSLRINATRYFDNLLQFQRKDMTEMWARLHEPVDKHRWQMVRVLAR